jgi:hypothetical protein
MELTDWLRHPLMCLSAVLSARRYADMPLNVVITDKGRHALMGDGAKHLQAAR